MTSAPIFPAATHDTADGRASVVHAYCPGAARRALGSPTWTSLTYLCRLALVEAPARLGRATVDVLAVLLDRDEPCWGLQLIKLTGRPSGTVYPLLDRLERIGWVVSHWDDDALRPGPRRRMYRLTPDGAVAARDTLRRAGQSAGTRARWTARPRTATAR